MRKFLDTTEGSIERQEFGYGLVYDLPYAKQYTIDFLKVIGINKPDAKLIFEYLNEWVKGNIATPDDAKAYDRSEREWLQNR